MRIRLVAWKSMRALLTPRAKIDARGALVRRRLVSSTRRSIHASLRWSSPCTSTRTLCRIRSSQLGLACERHSMRQKGRRWHFRDWPRQFHLGSARTPIGARRSRRRLIRGNRNRPRTHRWRQISQYVGYSTHRRRRKSRLQERERLPARKSLARRSP